MIKQLFIKLGLWEEEIHDEFIDFMKEAYKHYCRPCNRWFADTRGKLMHDRHKHK